MEKPDIDLREINLLELFKREAEAVAASVIVVKDRNGLAYEIGSFCRKKGISTLPAKLPPADPWNDLPHRLSAEGLTLIADISRESLENRKAALNAADFGIADTGTLVFFETSAVDVRPGTIPAYHMVLLDSRDIRLYATSITKEIDKFIYQCLADRKPCRVSMVSGPSRTADIERELTVGVHGPRELSIFILDETGG
jgi:L-lactate dehydrogenase complex protein LldG